MRSGILGKSFVRTWTTRRMNVSLLTLQGTIAKYGPGIIVTILTDAQVMVPSAMGRWGANEWWMYLYKISRGQAHLYQR